MDISNIILLRKRIKTYQHVAFVGRESRPPNIAVRSTASQCDFLWARIQAFKHWRAKHGQSMWLSLGENPNLQTLPCEARPINVTFFGRESKPSNIAVRSTANQCDFFWARIRTFKHCRAKHGQSMWLSLGENPDLQTLPCEARPIHVAWTMYGVNMAKKRDLLLH